MRLPSLRAGIILTGSLTLVVWASQPRQPILYVLRSVEAPLQVVLALIVLIAAMRLMHHEAEGKRVRHVARGAAFLALIALLLGVGYEEAFRRQQQSVLRGSEALRAVGSHFVIGYRGFEETAALAQRGLIGGIYLSRKFARGHSAEKIRADILALQHLREKAGLPPLIVAADQEGGEVSHLSPPLERMPSLASIAQSQDPLEIDTRAVDYGRQQGGGLAMLGVNLNLGPVADLLPTQTRTVFDTHTRLYRRAISDDPALVARIAGAYTRGLRERGVTATYKHFPGLARTNADTHHFPATLKESADTLAEKDWLPFRQAGSHGAAIMLGHVTLPELDAVRPASLSRPIVQNLIRQHWQFNGLLITDDLNMGAVFRRGICQIASEALYAGVDLVLISYDPDQFYPAIECAAKAYGAGKIDPRMLRESEGRIRRITDAYRGAYSGEYRALRQEREI